MVIFISIEQAPTNPVHQTDYEKYMANVEIVEQDWKCI